VDNKEIARFFNTTQVNIVSNPNLREPQRDAYVEISKHFEHSKEPCYIQLPVGCGKTGLMGITPFGNSEGRVLIITPNLTIKRTVLGELNISNTDCFYTKRNVFVPKDGPFISQLKMGANIHDCDNAHIVLANIQQFSGKNNKWYEKFSIDYFMIILVDEGHHNVAPTWKRLFKYFHQAKVVSYTATPLRSDGQAVIGKRIYSFSYTRSMMLGYISTIDSVNVAPEQVTFTAKNKKQTLSLEQVRDMREQDWFSRGIALSEECNRHIVQASLHQLTEVRKHGEPRLIIACTCSKRHAAQVASLYQEYGYKVEVLHYKVEEKEKDRIENALRLGTVDVVVQVNMLGEGYDLGTLSVAAVFRPYRSLSPYIQFIGRILRLAAPQSPHSPANKVYVVSHVGLNDERWWNDFTNFDKADQDFFASYLSGAYEEELNEGSNRPRMTLRPFMRVLNETVESYIKKGYLNKIDDVMIKELIDTIKQKGFDPTEFGLTEEVIRSRLESAQAETMIPAARPIAQPQNVRIALRQRASKEARAIADTVINRFGLKHTSGDLVRYFPGKGTTNAAILIALASDRQNKIMNISSGERDNATKEQFQEAISSSADIVDQLSKLLNGKLKKDATT
jgi:superfamily II DNA or RNA helicase